MRTVVSCSVQALSFTQQLLRLGQLAATVVLKININVVRRAWGGLGETIASSLLLVLFGSGQSPDMVLKGDRPISTRDQA